MITEIQYREFIHQILFIIVIYKKAPGESSAMRSLQKELIDQGFTPTIFVYDNSPEDQSPVFHQENLFYHHDPANSGVSKAYNCGLAVARKDQKKWLLLLDQDTFFGTDAFVEYFKSWQRYSNQKVFVPILLDTSGIVSPLKFKRGGGQRVADLKTGVHSLHDFLFHNSGLLISGDIFEEVGGYDELLPLDFSDFSFIEKARKFLSTFVVIDLSCEHPLASTSHATLENRATRFASYVKACVYFRKTYKPYDWMIPARLLLRSLKLSYKHRTLKFIFIYFLA